jgi:hypothetical protein
VGVSSAFVPEPSLSVSISPAIIASDGSPSPLGSPSTTMNLLANFTDTYPYQPPPFFSPKLMPWHPGPQGSVLTSLLVFMSNTVMFELKVPTPSM